MKCRWGAAAFVALVAPAAMIFIACGSFGSLDPSPDGGGAIPRNDASPNTAETSTACRGDGGASSIRVEVATGAFCIDATETTAEAYDVFLVAVKGDAGGIALPARCGSTPDLAQDQRATTGLPAGTLSWCSATAYCAWVGKRLCSVSEWQSTCTGGDPTRSYPYGATFQAGVCNDDIQHCARTGLKPVGSLPGCVSPSKVYDLSGNAREWLATCDGADGGCRISNTFCDEPGALTCASTITAEPTKRGNFDWGVRCCADAL